MSDTKTSAIVLSILTLTTVVAGKFKESFCVADQDGALIGTKAHATSAEAELELGSLKYFTAGMDFARATAKEGTADKSLVGKANVVAAYLMYQEQLANPTTEESPSEESPESPTEEAPAKVGAQEEF